MLDAGTVLAGRYQLLEQIGAGGMSVVYRAMDQRLNREVSVKVMREDFSNDPVQVEKFRKEAMAIAMIHHPNIAEIYDIGQERGLEYMVKEYVDGITLKEYIARRRQMTSDEIVKITLKIAEALKAAHDIQIVHRDIKPQNILVTPRGEVKVTDFGIAKLLQSSTETNHNDVMGSVHYISPEQAKGLRADERSDLYSLGITMYEMAAGHPPFKGDVPVAVVMQQIHEPLPPISDPKIWGGISSIINGLTQKDPEDRYQNSRALIADLKKVYNDPTHQAIFPTVGVFRGGKSAADPPRRTDPTGPIRTVQTKSSASYSDANTGAATVSYAEPTIKRTSDTVRIYSPSQNQDGTASRFVIPVLGTICGVMAAVLLILLILTVKGCSKPKNEEFVEYTIPNLSGMTVEEAKSFIARMKMNLTLVESATRKFSDQYAEGEIISQTPDGKTVVTSPDNVNVTVLLSKGSKPEDSLDSYENKTFEEAVEELTSLGIEFSVDMKEIEKEDENGLVLEQTPAPGTVISSDLYVTLTVGCYVEEDTVVPDLLTHTEEEARKLLKEKELAVGKVNSVPSSQPKNSIIAQSIEEGTLLPKGQAVDITVSGGEPIQKERKDIGFLDLNGKMFGKQEGVNRVRVECIASADGSQETLYKSEIKQEDWEAFQQRIYYKEGTTSLSIYLNGKEVDVIHVG